MLLEHINIRSPRHVLEKEKEFFCELFDLTVGYRPAFKRLGYWLYSGDKPLIHLTECSERRAHSTPGYFDHIAFGLNDLAAFINKLDNMSVAYSRDRIPELALTQLFFYSPAGIGLEASFTNKETAK